MAIELLFNLLGAALLVGTLLGVGARLRRAFRIPCSPGLRAPVEWILGSWCVGLAVLIVGLAGGMWPLPLASVLTVLAAAADWRAAGRRARELLPWLLLGVPLLPVALSPPFFYDAWVYHLGMPWQALQDGALRPHPENLFSTFPPLAQLLYAPPLAAGLLRVPALLHLFAFCVAARSVCVLARRLGAPRWSATFAGACIPYLPVAAIVPAFPAAEGWIVTGIVTGIALGLTGRPRTSRSFGALWVAGAGAAARLQGFPWALLILGASVAHSRTPIRTGFVGIAGLILGTAPWWAKNAVLLGDPLAPIGWRREGIETLWRDAGSSYFLAEGASDLVARVLYTLGENPWLLGPLLLAALVAAWSRGRRSSLLALGLLAAGVGLWCLTGTLGRFLVPTLALALALGAAGLRPVRLAAAFTAVVLVAAPGLLATGRDLHALGWSGMRLPVSEVFAQRVVANPHPAFEACEALPEEARVLMIAEPRGFLMPRRFTTTSQHDRSPLAEIVGREADADRIRDELRASGFTHLLFNTAEMQRLGERYPVLPWRDLEQRGRVEKKLVGTLGVPVVDRAPVKVYALGLSEGSVGIAMVESVSGRERGRSPRPAAGDAFQRREPLEEEDRP